MKNIEKSPRKLGIIGGGQLAMFTCQAAKKLGIETFVLALNDDSPSINHADNHLTINDFSEQTKLEKFLKEVDVITCETENVDVQSLEKYGYLDKYHPSLEVLKIAQNRILEKDFIRKCGLNTANYKTISTQEELINGVGEFSDCILKTAENGYDGKGQIVLGKDISSSYLTEIFKEFDKRTPPTKNFTAKFILEEKIDFICELSAIVGMHSANYCYIFPAVSNIHKDGILRESSFPANFPNSNELISEDIIKNCEYSALKLTQKLNLKGLLTVEFFLGRDAKLYVNELAPRPHNSGHWTINATDFSQFDILVRSIFDIKNPDLTAKNKNKNITAENIFQIPIPIKFSATMLNLIGDDIKKIAEFKAQADTFIFDYGKKAIKAGRKMGHITILKSKTS